MGIVYNSDRKNGIVVSEATSHPSYPRAFKSSFYVEDEHEDAHIKVDFDTHKNPIRIETIVKAISNATHYRHAKLGTKFPLIVREALVFSTGRGHHLRLWFDTDVGVIPAATVLRIQAACGDDPQRQKFNAARVKRGEAGWNVLWRSKWKNGNLLSKEVIHCNLTQTLNDRLRAVRARRSMREVLANAKKTKEKRT